MSTARDAGLPFGRYVLRELIARGGMGEVFGAVAVGAGGFEKPVVVKRILPQLGGSEMLAEMFISEARLMSRLVHPNIVQVFDFGRGESDDYFLVMELVDGVDLRTFYKHYGAGGMPSGLALFIASQVLRGLHHAHEKGHDEPGVERTTTLVHRDVSPGNVLLSKVGEVKVADFGVALVTTRDASGEPTTLAGKLGYMAPEQHHGDPLDGRADVFSCGVVLFQMLTGESPFDGATPEEQQACADRGEFRRLRDYREDLPEEIEAIIEQALAPDRGRRFATARAMNKAIDGACAGDLPMANSDDLAEAVERVVRSRGNKGKPVVALADGAALREGTIVQRGDAKSHFTMRVTNVTGGTVPSLMSQTTSSVAPELPEQPTESVVLPKPSLKPALWVIVGVALISGIIGAITVASPPAALPSAEPSAFVTTSSASSSTSSDSESGTSTSEGSTSTSTSDPQRTTTTTTTPPAQSAVVDSGCRGKVLLASKGSWWVTGGPSKVQAPGHYEWPCGGYGLTGTSRVDQRTMTRAINVTEGGTASARFE